MRYLVILYSLYIIIISMSKWNKLIKITDNNANKIKSFVLGSGKQLLI